jgi:hypothetical protein
MISFIVLVNHPFPRKMAREWVIMGIVDWIKEREPWLKKELNWPKRFPVVATCTQALVQCNAHEVEQAMMCVIRKARERQQKMEKCMRDQINDKRCIS